MSKRTVRISTIAFGLVLVNMAIDSTNAAQFKVATWNIAWLNAELNTGTIPRSSDDYLRLAQYAERLEGDVIALQEIDGADAAGRVFSPSEYSFYFSDDNRTQSVGFAIRQRDDISVLAKVDVDELDVTGRLRRGVDITLSLDGTIVRFLAVHLKSFCFEEDLDQPSGEDCPDLAQQLPHIERWIDSRAEEPYPFVVLGDFNRRLDIPGDDFWREIDDSMPDNADLSRVNAGMRPPCWNDRFDEYIDHIVVDPRTSLLVVPGTTEQLIYDQSHASFERELSDHCPLSVIFDTDR